MKFGTDVTLQAGDGVRIKGPFDFAVEGSGELILWDTPSLEQAIAKQ